MVKNKDKIAIVKNIISFIFTVVAIGIIMFGTCFLNMSIVDHNEYLIVPLIIIWPLFPLILFAWIAYKTKNAGIKWAVIALSLGALFLLAEMLG